MIRLGLMIVGMLPLLFLAAANAQGEPPLSVRLLVSNSAPYTGEEVVLAMEVCYRGRPMGRPLVRWPTLDDFAAEEMRALPPRREEGGGRIVETQRRALRPLASGRYTLDGGVTLGDLFIAAPPLNLKVRPLPSRGRPSDFKGAVGQAELLLRAEGTGTREMKLVMEGNAPLDAFPTPNLEPGPGERLVPLGEDFSGDAGGVRERIFRYLYLPGEGRRGNLSASLSLFEPATGRYRRLDASLNPAVSIRQWLSLPALAALLGGLCLTVRRRGRRARSLDAILERLLERSPNGVCRDRIRDELGRAGLPAQVLDELMRMWALEDRVRYSGQPQAKTPDELRIRVAALLRNAVDKSRPIP